MKIRPMIAHPAARRLRRLPWPARLLLCVAAVTLGCDGGPSAPDPATGLAAPWQSASPASQGFDAAKLEAVVGRARAQPRMLSLLVARNGVLVVEEYFNGSGRENLNDVRSVTKSVVSTLAGIAIARGELRLDTRIADHLARWAADLDDVERTITVRDLLTMGGGWRWDESTAAGYNDWVLSPDPVAYVLRSPREATPGTRFDYNSGAVHLLGVVLEDATGRTLQQYAREHLFAPLGIERAEWEVFADGRANAAAGLDLRPRDLAKLGQLWLQRGDAGSARVIGTSWIDDASSPAWPSWQAAPPLGRQSYGRLWWLSESPGPPATFAWGHGGQFVWIVPSLDLVVVVTQQWRDSPVSAAQMARNGLELIVEGVIPAVQ